MPLAALGFAGDEELGKKNDDYRPRKNGSISIPAWLWTPKNGSSKYRRRRLVILFVALIVFYLLCASILSSLRGTAKSSDGAAGQTSKKDATPSSKSPASPANRMPTNAPPRPVGYSAEDHFYDGEIKFYYLGTSLHAVARIMGQRQVNKNVLFAAGNLQSASRLIPVACDMARWNRNIVHFAFMGREDLQLKDIKDINGVGPDCEIFWHDARPDHAPWSTEARMQGAVIGALGHFQTFMHPQVYIVDHADSEEPFFIRAARLGGDEHDTPLIELPINAVQSLMWMTRLDSGALRAWHNTYIDILIQAPTNVSGSLMRLVRSIEAADYGGFRRPHLTIELPPEIPPSTLNFLQNLIWPPMEPLNGAHVSAVTLRHRIPTNRFSQSEASVRLLESFYPIRRDNSHVLLLSPDVELSPLYFHYLMYHTLEYHNSAYSSGFPEVDALMGISLSQPEHLLDGLTGLAPPSSSDDDKSQFRWQAPNPSASLIFGSKWAELHSFLSIRLAATSDSLKSRTKIISPSLPAWTEFALELMRARGYSLLYPDLPPKHAIATIHNELYEPPEEFLHPASQSSSRSASSTESGSALSVESEPFLLPPEPPPTKTHNHEQPLAHVPLTALLPNDGDLPELASLPLLSYDGRTVLSTATNVEASSAYAEAFRIAVGICRVRRTTKKLLLEGRADDLFCYLDDEDAGTRRSLTNDDLTTGDPATDAVLATFNIQRSTNTEQVVDWRADRARMLQHAGRRYGASGHNIYDEPMSEEKMAGMREEFRQHLQRQAMHHDAR